MDTYQFDPIRARDSLVRDLQELAKAQGFTKVVLGISGGKDSSVTAALCARALGKENVYGVLLPDGEQLDIADSRRVCEALGIHAHTVNIGPLHAALREATDQNIDPKEQSANPDAGEQGAFRIPYDRESDINVGPRLRMTVLRYIAQALGARLAGTGNLSEATVGYCTKDGDTSCDFAMLGALTSVEVVEVGRTLPELPRELVEKTPTDGLSGQSDEARLGLTYAQIHAYLRAGTCGDPDVDAQIRRREKANLHKRQMPRVLNPLREEGENT